MQTLQQARAGTRPDVRAAAFFDVDNTLVPGQAIELRFFRYLWKKGLVGPKEAARSLWHLLRHVPPVSLHPLRERKLYLEGKRPADIEPLAESFVRSHICPAVASEGLAALDKHRRAERHLVLVTASPDFLIAPLAAFLNVEMVLAARPEQTGDRYTGGLLPPFPYGTGKRRLIEALAQQQGLVLSECYAYGDSPGDVEALQSVGHPLVVNPIRGMGRIAQRHGWPVAKWE
ncbi:MAG: HAD-IB family hydrolase [Nitrospira sp.]|nr:HAD-IB family hydrolase [Nitrospira sp.]